MLWHERDVQHCSQTVCRLVCQLQALVAENDAERELQVGIEHMTQRCPTNTAMAIFGNISLRVCIQLPMHGL